MKNYSRCQANLYTENCLLAEKFEEIEKAHCGQSYRILHLIQAHF